MITKKKKDTYPPGCMDGDNIVIACRFPPDQYMQILEYKDLHECSVASAIRQLCDKGLNPTGKIIR